MEIEHILKSRKMLTDKLYKYQRNGGKDHIKLDIDKKILQQILFENNEIAIPDNLWKLLDLSGVSFDGIDVMKIDFTGSKGVVIDPQTVYDKDLSNAKLAGVEIKGSFDGVDVYGTDFTGSEGAIIDPQEVSSKDLSYAKLAGVEINGSFDGVDVRGTDFTGSKGVIKLDPQTVYDKNLKNTKLADVEITGSFDAVYVRGADFTGSKGVIKLDPQTLYDKNLRYAKLAGVEITGLLDDVKLEGTDFTGSKGALMCFEEAEVAIKLDANLTNVEIITYGKIEDKIEEAFQPQLKLE